MTNVCENCKNQKFCKYADKVAKFYDEQVNEYAIPDCLTLAISCKFKPAAIDIPAFIRSCNE